MDDIVKYTIEQALVGAEISYQQEKGRSETLLLKSDNIIKYISILFVVYNFAYSFMYDAFKDSIDSSIVFLSYFMVLLIAICAMVFAVQAQALVKVRYFLNGKEFIESVIDCEPLNETDILMSLIKAYACTTIDLKNSNDKKSEMISKSFNILLASMFVFIMSILAIILINEGFLLANN